jgi:hypothetical protein
VGAQFGGLELKVQFQLVKAKLKPGLMFETGFRTQSGISVFKELELGFLKKGRVSVVKSLVFIQVTLNQV